MRRIIISVLEDNVELYIYYNKNIFLYNSYLYSKRSVLFNFDFGSIDDDNPGYVYELISI